ncbi:hypothetical protein [Streptomyces thermodiastaticus]|uniref:hypothetical protein n=1 Tax=Streptomyces thermodiastaticus TaxID=44061 RepID=UPI001994ECDE|nr:hypothetical protein [Streptomyces thermodiastaticus]MCE7550826.1 hypothetical protein [Streptomyces thermodiastaticus]GHF74513.1 hypothetical protein GCM10018787_24070 [Streptomyces thermodiastaticus]
MRARPDTGEAPSTGQETERQAPRRRIDLSVPQVAGSALAAVVAAKLASYFGVYGTILGAGVVSVIATCGGPVFQHFFRRTGEQLRTVTSARPAVAPAPRDATGRSAAPTRVATVVRDPADGAAPIPGGYSQGTVYRARRRGWKRPAVAALLVFVVTMGGITVYELVSGDSFSGGRGTTVGNAVTGHHTSPAPSGDGTPRPSDTRTTAPGTGGTATPGGGTEPGTTPGAGRSSGTTAPSTTAPGDGPASGGTEGTDGTGSGDGTGEQSTAPSPEASSATSPGPSADSRSGNGAQDPGGPAAR